MRIKIWNADEGLYYATAEKSSRYTGIGKAKVHPKDSKYESDLVGFTIAELRARIDLKKKIISNKKKTLKQMEGIVKSFKDGLVGVEKAKSSLEQELEKYLKGKEKLINSLENLFGGKNEG